LSGEVPQIKKATDADVVKNGNQFVKGGVPKKSRGNRQEWGGKKNRLCWAGGIIFGGKKRKKPKQSFNSMAGKGGVKAKGQKFDIALQHIPVKKKGYCVGGGGKTRGGHHTSSQY